jgi:hypothetical protein
VKLSRLSREAAPRRVIKRGPTALGSIPRGISRLLIPRRYTTRGPTAL